MGSGWTCMAMATEGVWMDLRGNGDGRAMAAAGGGGGSQQGRIKMGREDTMSK